MKKAFAVMVGCVALVMGALYFTNPQDTQPAAVPEAPQVAKQSVAEASPVAKAEDDGVAPETEAALAQFGLSAKHVVAIRPVGKSRQPIVLNNPLLARSVQ